MNKVKLALGMQLMESAITLKGCVTCCTTLNHSNLIEDSFVIRRSRGVNRLDDQPLIGVNSANFLPVHVSFSVEGK